MSWHIALSLSYLAVHVAWPAQSFWVLCRIWGYLVTQIMRVCWQQTAWAPFPQPCSVSLSWHRCLCHPEVCAASTLLFWKFSCVGHWGHSACLCRSDRHSNWHICSVAAAEADSWRLQQSQATASCTVLHQESAGAVSERHSRKYTSTGQHLQLHLGEAQSEVCFHYSADIL